MKAVSSLLSRSLIFAFVAAAAGTLAHGQQLYRVTDLGVIPGQQNSYGMALNEQGQVAGYSEFFAARYTNGVQENLGVLPGGIDAKGHAINNLGEVVGYSTFENGGAIRHAALFRNGTVTDLGFVPNWGNYSLATAINHSTQVVGYSGASRDTTNTRAFIWDAGNGLRDLGTLGGGFAKAFGINNAGQVTGHASTNTPNSRVAFIWEQATGMRPLGTLAGDFSTGNFINANGHVAGTSTINTFDNRQHAFLYDGVTMRDLGSLGPDDFLSDRSAAYAVNIHDHVVGSTYLPYQGGALYAVAFIYRDGQMQNLEAMLDASGAGYRLGSASGINDAGQIVSTASKGPNNDIRAVLLTPLQRLVSAASRKTHGTAGAFDLDLPLSGAPAVECRAPVGGVHTVVFTFANNVTGGTAAISEGTATINGASSFNGKTMTLHLSDVADRQTITVALSGVTDSFGDTMAPASVRMTLMLGDTTGNGAVTSSDIAQTKASIGAPITTANFRTDVTANGSINSSDLGAVKAASGGGATTATAQLR